MAGGRPKGDTKYTPEMDDIVVREMSVGASKVEVCAELGISKRTMELWANPESEYFKESFFRAVKKGEELSNAWWLKEGRLSLRDRDFNAGLWFMNMKNRHGWADKQERKSDTSLKIEIINYSDLGKNE